MPWDVNGIPFKEMVPCWVLGEVSFVALSSQFLFIGRHVLKQLPLGKCLNGSLICAVRGSIDARTPTRGELPLLHPPYARVFAGYCSAQPNALRLFFKHNSVVEIEEATADV